MSGKNFCGTPSAEQKTSREHRSASRRHFRTDMSLRAVLLVLCLALLGITLAPRAGEAHRLLVFAYVEGGILSGEAYFNDGAPVKQCPVSVTDDEGRETVSGTTDEGGRFALVLPEGLPAKTLLVSVNGGGGHKGTFRLDMPDGGSPPEKAAPAAGTASGTVLAEQTRQPTPPETPSGALPSPEALETFFTATLEKALDENAALRRVALLEGKLAALQEELLVLRRELAGPRIPEILGGIGYIIGITGAALWALSRKGGSGKR
ncbi:carboxypeptidase-like regulatory domain-containing protein [Aminiphilus sp.]|uniref:carboxypeptidase-like regulatory domain-containing protein n=1 Tax=Aminiphilus sp. TaxID=1872488 RepID=UPI00262E3232|nr:carboxypeptidase-like regulatory domain-containing protein [Aminiphilus sp.]